MTRTLARWRRSACLLGAVWALVGARAPRGRAAETGPGAESLGVSAATTIIEAEEIRLSGATSLPELLRRVPGLDVVRVTASHYAVAIRGAGGRLSGQVLVLVDGRSVYENSLGTTLWQTLAVGLDEIERIEVTRGPASARYGPNAFGGVVRILTRPPRHQTRGALGVALGPAATLRLAGRYTGSRGRLSWRVSGGAEEVGKLEKLYDESRPDIALNVSGFDRSLLNLAMDIPNYDRSILSVRARGLVRYLWPDGDQEWSFTVGTNQFVTEQFGDGLQRNLFLRGNASYAQTDYHRGVFDLRVYYNHTDLIAGPESHPVGGPDGRTPIIANILDAEPRLTFGFELAGHHELVAGFEYRLEGVQAWNWLDRDPNEHHVAGFVSESWQVGHALRLEAAYRLDQGWLVGLTHSPRVAVVVAPAAGHSLHISYSVGHHTPSELESHGDIRFDVPQTPGLVLAMRPDRDLTQERVRAIELGWEGHAGERVDIAADAFVSLRDREIGLSEGAPAGTSDPKTGRIEAYAFHTTNLPGTRRVAGVELSARARPVDGLELYAGYAFRATRLSDAARGRSAYGPRHSGTFGGRLVLRSGFEASLDLALAGESRWDVPSVCGAVGHPTSSCADAGALIVEPRRLSRHLTMNARLGYQVIPDRLVLAASVEDLTNSRHREHPLGNRMALRAQVSLTSHFGGATP